MISATSLPPRPTPWTRLGRPLTRAALAAVAGVGLIEDAASLERIRAMFAARGRMMPDRNRVQAHHPAGAEPIFNPAGTAPG